MDVNKDMDKMIRQFLEKCGIALPTNPIFETVLMQTNEIQPDMFVEKYRYLAAEPNDALTTMVSIDRGPDQIICYAIQLEEDIVTIGLLVNGIPTRKE